MGTLLAGSTAHADIHRWDTGEVIPGSEGIEPEPGVQLDHRELEYARLSSLDLIGANFEESNLASASFSESDLMAAKLRGTKLTNSTVRDVGWTDADLSNAIL